ncbi:MAG: DUF1573 domain-containing protein [Bacteroidia bacterium]
MKQFKSLLILILVSCLAVGMQAQTKVMQKEVKKAFKAMTDVQKEALIKYANLGLAGKDGDVSITDKKSLNKNFRLLTPKHQEQVLKYAKAQIEVPAAPAMAVNKPGELNVKKPAPNSTVLYPNPQKAAPKPPTAPQNGTVQAPPAPPQPTWMVKAESLPKTEVEWYEQSFDFGKIQEGDVVTHTFRFKNVGANPLLLTRVKPSCGCTSPKWSSEEIAPGEEGEVAVSFNSSHKRGMQSKSVVITFNGNPVNKVLTFRAEVMPKDAPAGGSN